MIRIRDFSPDDIAELNNYILSQIPQSVLPRLFILTEEPVKKVRAFIAIYRILESCKDYVGTKELYDKIDKHISKGTEAYREIYPILIDYDSSELQVMKERYFNRIKEKMIYYNNQINYVINTFLVFAEKIDLIPVNTVSGIKMSEDTGKNIYESLSKLVEE